MTTSTVYHFTKNPMILYLDHTACFALTASTIHLSIKNGHTIIPIICGLYIFTTYYIGYNYTIFIWNPDKNVSTFYHMSLHFVSNFISNYVMSLGQGLEHIER